MQLYRRSLKKMTEWVGWFWHSVLSVRRRRVIITKPKISLSHFGRAATKSLHRFFLNPLLWLTRQPLWWCGIGVTFLAFLGWGWFGKAWMWLSQGEVDPARTIRDIVLALATPITIILAVWRSRVAAAAMLRDRYQRSAEMLGHSDRCSVRLGGIHALASLADEHRSIFHLQTMQLFAAYVVDHTSGDRASEPVDPTKNKAINQKTDNPGLFVNEFMKAAFSEGEGVPDLPSDVREALGLIAKRNRPQVALERRKGLRLNLSGAVLIRLVQMKPAANFSNIDFSYANLSHARLWGAQFSGAVMTGARLLNASLSRANLRGVDLRGADLTCARLIDADLRQANLKPRNRVGEWATGWEGRQTRLRGAHLICADMRGANIYAADFKQADLGGVNLDNAQLAQADLRGADLRSAVFYEANLTGANLSNANLRSADLTGANLSLANLTEADLTGANLSGADFTRDHMRMRRQSPRKLHPATGLTQDQLDLAQADPYSPPNLKGVLDSITERPLVWNGQSCDD